MRRRALLFTSVLTVAVFAPSGRAVTIDFNDLPFTVQTGHAPYNNFAPLPDSVVTDRFRPVGVVFGREGISAGVAVFQALADSRRAAAALDASGLIPGENMGGFVGDTYFRFVLPGTDIPAGADDVRFTVGDAGGDTDVFEIRSYGVDDLLIDRQSFTTVAYRPVTIPAGGIHRVEIDFTGPLGYVVDDLSFNIIPEPSALALVIIGGAAALSRRVRRSSSRT